MARGAAKKRRRKHLSAQKDKPTTDNKPTTAGSSDEDEPETVPELPNPDDHYYVYQKAFIEGRREGNGTAGDDDLPEWYATFPCVVCWLVFIFIVIVVFHISWHSEDSLDEQVDPRLLFGTVLSTLYVVTMAKLGYLHPVYFCYLRTVRLFKDF